MAFTRQKMLYLIKSSGPQTATELAALLGITPAGVRQHLQVLQREGLLLPTEERKAVGRPARRWHLSDAAQALFPDGHRKLAAGLLETLAESLPEDELKGLMEGLTRKQIEGYRRRMPARETTLEERVRAIAELRTEDGYMAECHAVADGRWILVENNCPICTAAAEFPPLCTREPTLFRALLGDGVAIERTEHLLNGSRRCVYEISRGGVALRDPEEVKSPPEELQ